MTILGLDVSHWDKGTKVPLIDWAQAGQQYKFVFMKCSEGDYYRDSLFKAQWRAAEGYVLRGAYHFFRGVCDAIKQAQLMIEMVNGDWGELPPVCDFEENYVPLKLLGSFLYEIEKVSQRTPIIYTGLGYWTSSGGQTSAGKPYARYPLWLASYWYDRSAQFDEWYAKMMLATDVTFPKPPKPWDKASIWQWTARGKPKDVPGYPVGKRAVDFNLFNGTATDLEAWIGGALVPTPPVVKRVKVTAFPWLRVRSGPGTSHSIVGTLLYGSKAQVVDVQGVGRDQWAKLADGNWIALVYNGQRLAA